MQIDSISLQYLARAESNFFLVLRVIKRWHQIHIIENTKHMLPLPLFHLLANVWIELEKDLLNKNQTFNFDLSWF